MVRGGGYAAGGSAAAAGLIELGVCVAAALAGGRRGWAGVQGPWRGGRPARDVDQLAVIIRNRLTRIWYRPALIEAFLAQTGLTLEPQPR
jgi:hypothetical protein